MSVAQASESREARGIHYALLRAARRRASAGTVRDLENEDSFHVVPVFYTDRFQARRHNVGNHLGLHDSLVSTFIARFTFPACVAMK